MNTKQMECFIAAAECRSLREASERVFASVSTISRQVAALEEEIGAQLFLRTHTEWHLTPAGSIIYRSIRQILQQQMRDYARAREVGTSGEERLRVAFFRFSNPDTVLLEIINDFQLAHPALELEVFCYDVSMQEKFLRENHCDLAFGFDWEMPTGASYRSLPVFAQRTALYIGRANRDFLRPGFEPSMLQDPTVWCIEGYNQMVYERQIYEAMHYLGIPRWHLRQAHNWDTAWMNVAVGNGVVISDALVASPRAREYAAFPIPSALLPGNVRLCWRADTENPLVPLFIAAVEEGIRQNVAKTATKSRQ